MEFVRLRLSGFKSFVEPAELRIEEGLTGVVGPNGCGKSNLLEALRWVMGESSYKSMRASGMEDVIFAGTSQRPSRNRAEVVLTLSNEDKTAPPSYNENDFIEVSRLIERDKGSNYCINGHEQRARDVQLLFADSSTGSRSPALVRQGKIAELINAKPHVRRMILEEAAGIMGLHTRRHDAELKLKAAGQNLNRLDDIIGQLENQLINLKRQSHRAQKYKSLSADIQQMEIMSLYIIWCEARQSQHAQEQALGKIIQRLADCTQKSVEAQNHRDELGVRLTHLREQEIIRASVVQRLENERNGFDEEEIRVSQQLQGVQARLRQAQADLVREQEVRADMDDARTRLHTEEAELLTLQQCQDAAHKDAAQILQSRSDDLTEAQNIADQAHVNFAEFSARHDGLKRALAEQQTRLEKSEKDLIILRQRQADLSARSKSFEDLQRFGLAVREASDNLEAQEKSVEQSEQALILARIAENEARKLYDQALMQSMQLQAEISTLSKILHTDQQASSSAILDTLFVTPGYEIAVGAALGEDLEASLDEAAVSYWRHLPQELDLLPLPDGAVPLSQFVRAPAALARRFASIGIVEPTLGHRLQEVLFPGQRLVSCAGDLWRWDGFSVGAEAPSAAARRLAERNQLASVQEKFSSHKPIMEQAQAHFEQKNLAVEDGIKNERLQRDARRQAAGQLEKLRYELLVHERKNAEIQAEIRTQAHIEQQLCAAQAEAQRAHEQIVAALQALPVDKDLQHRMVESREHANKARALVAEARASYDRLDHEARSRSQRLTLIATEHQQWQQRIDKAQMQSASLRKRVEEAQKTSQALMNFPQEIAQKRQRLLSMLHQAEQERKEASDALANMDNAVREADRMLRDIAENLGQVRQDQARHQAHFEMDVMRLQQAEQRIFELCNTTAEQIAPHFENLRENAGDLAMIEKKIALLRQEREQLGPVNLRAQEDMQEAEASLQKLTSERDDVLQAVAKLRSAIASLNKEGRLRLLEAFNGVNEKFSALFMTLFGGGHAQLQLIESEDPLEAGLEIFANPPGKKPQILSLMSGGEQTLTAMALIFSVFLTNPSPICVLDEVDAPLDDHNVERFCNLLDAMLERTKTRFLIITHHPLTMARMHRLYGVTMMERGVSQLVSVNLQEAEILRDVG